MREITEKLKADIQSKIEPILHELRAKGYSDRELEGFILTHTKMKVRHTYTAKRELKPITPVFQEIIDGLVEMNQDSKAEGLFMETLKDAHIIYDFHYKIGPYIADFLIDRQLVVELDGPQHSKQVEYDERRDKYMERMGYEVLRIPLNFFILDKNAVIDAVQDARAKVKSSVSIT